MKIAFDVFGMVISKGRGIGNYSAGLVRELIARHPEDEYYLFNLADGDFQLPGGIPHGAKVTVFHRYLGSNGRLIAVDGEAVGDIFRKFIHENGIDIFYLTTAIEWSSNGETSASLYRILAAGCVAIVNNSGSFTQVPSDICLKLPPADGLTEDQEVLAISNAMRKCLESPAWLKATGEKARAFAESMLTPAKAARAYRDFIEKPVCRGFTTNVVSAMAGTLKNGDEFERKNGLGKLCETIAWAKGD